MFGIASSVSLLAPPLGATPVSVDKDFMVAPSDICWDTNWRLFDPDTSNVRYATAIKAYEAAARPDADQEYENNWTGCLLEYAPEYLSVAYVIPLDPLLAPRPDRTDKSGSIVAFDGARLDALPPGDAVLSTYMIVGFNDCGGHVNKRVGYHDHAGEAGADAILGCLVARVGCIVEQSGDACDANATPHHL